MADLGPEWLTVILFGSLILLLLTGLPLVFAIGGVATFFIIVLWGPHALPILANRTYMAMDLFLLVAVTLQFHPAPKPAHPMVHQLVHVFGYAASLEHGAHEYEHRHGHEQEQVHCHVCSVREDRQRVRPPKDYDEERRDAADR
ncbi:MAG: hypothetical protein AAFN27_20045, partial [Pseudomonadota bacterium]